jgi:hypothetical protein
VAEIGKIGSSEYAFDSNVSRLTWMPRSDKTGYAIALIEKLQATSSDASKVPQFLQTVIEDVIAKAS